MPETYAISELAREFDITTRTIRYYEDQGLLRPARNGRRRVYSSVDRVRLKLILRGKRLGFALGEIRDIIDMYNAEAGEVGQLHYLCERIDQSRKILLRRREDIRDMDQIEAQCRATLERMQTAS